MWLFSFVGRTTSDEGGEDTGDEDTSGDGDDEEDGDGDKDDVVVVGWVNDICVRVRVFGWLSGVLDKLEFTRMSCDEQMFAGNVEE